MPYIPTVEKPVTTLLEQAVREHAMRDVPTVTDDNAMRGWIPTSGFDARESAMHTVPADNEIRFSNAHDRDKWVLGITPKEEFMGFNGFPSMTDYHNALVGVNLSNSIDDDSLSKFAKMMGYGMIPKHFMEGTSEPIELDNVNGHTLKSLHNVGSRKITDEELKDRFILKSASNDSISKKYGLLGRIGLNAAGKDTIYSDDPDIRIHELKEHGLRKRYAND